MKLQGLSLVDVSIHVNVKMMKMMTVFKLMGEFNVIFFKWSIV